MERSKGEEIFVVFVLFLLFFLQWLEGIYLRIKGKGLNEGRCISESCRMGFFLQSRQLQNLRASEHEPQILCLYLSCLNLLGQF